ncbi:uncharacterized protein AKAW2_11236A [Aspergillus luchuensis]|uniref:Uncharacterized protein n=1 Tax=Aspergillus kawachii TaxID=1069201 RepID=A0A7R7WPV0_ASPKA|nr:uncharacterized protein AKAW2_11236A [Aspergillus luchuensis]BCR94190.1 hypothetical protein AKAW2_11236A [Aspergillus luchuensis]BCS06799.1 hypothetical protein ALUC_11180A [Aspergillus luchuensis]
MASPAEREGRLAVSANARPSEGIKQTKERRPGQFSRHPISQLQGPFEESIQEAIGIGNGRWVANIDAQSRRKILLESPNYERLCGRKWRQRADERYHPLWKLIAQMSFGVHLLVGKLAKSDVEVLKILQVHVDEMDGFLKRTSEDFLIIQIDVRTRSKYLSLPLENLMVFDEMLEDRSFRGSMIEYNDRIEHAIDRFATAIEDSLKDIQKGREAVGALWTYLQQSAEKHSPLPVRLLAVYQAMLANAEGWNIALSNLRRKGVALQSALLQLGLATTELQRRVGVASRKAVVSYMRSTNGLTRKKSLRQRFMERGSFVSAPASTPNKPLPRAPDRPATATLSRSTDRNRLTQKSVPNLRAARENDERNPHTKLPDRAKSVNGTTDGFDSEGFVLKLRRLSRSKLRTRELASEHPEPLPVRPSTAPSRASKARSIYLEPLKSLHKSKREPSQKAHTSMVPAQTERLVAAQPSARRETMKNQLLQYFKSDKVVDAWEHETQKEKSNPEDSSQAKKAGPWSEFCAESSINDDGCLQIKSDMVGSDLNNDMAWLQEDAGAMNTYSLKPKRDVGPRIHVLSVQFSLAQDDNELENQDPEAELEDTQSVITALPSIPAAPVNTEEFHPHSLYPGYNLGHSPEPATVFT